MAITRCPNGHFYDSEQNQTCPWCATMPQPAAANSTQRVAPQMQQSTVAISTTAFEGATMKISGSQPVQNSVDEGHTVVVVKKNTGIDPVVGWLVCIDGPDRGRDYKIRSEKNAIGRSTSMDICISGDETIARNDHAFVVYDPKRNVFRIQAGLSRGLVYLNEKEVINSETLKSHDTIEIGESTFKFVPFCGEEFQWNAKKQQED